MADLQEGRTGVAPDGTRVIVRNGQIVPMDDGASAAGFTDLGDGFFRSQDGGVFQRNRQGQLIRRTGTAGGNEASQRGARKDFEGLPDVKKFREIRSAFETIQAAARDASGASDLALIFALNKLFDPTSVVREGEFDRTAAVGGLPARVQSSISRVRNGQTLTPDLRREIVETAQSLYEVRRDAYNDTVQRYQDLARDDGLNPQAVARQEFRGQRVTSDPERQEMGQANTAQVAARPDDYSPLAQLGTAQRPYVLSPGVTADQLPAGAVYIDTNGRLVDPATPNGGSAGATAETAIDYTAEGSQGDLAALIRTGGWLRNGDGEPYYVAPGGIQTAAPQEGDEAASRGVFVRPQARAEDAPQRYAERPRWQQRLESGVHTAADFLTLGLADEVVAGVDAMLGRGGEGSFLTRAERLRSSNEEWRRDAQRDHPVSALAGGVGAIGATLPLSAGAAAANWSAPAARVVATPLERAAATTAGYGAAYGLGSGQGNALERLPSAAQGFAAGSAFGLAVPPVVSALATHGGRAVQGVRSALSRVVSPSTAPQPNVLSGAVSQFGARTGQNPSALRSEAERFRAAGIEPTLADVTDSSGRGMLRSLATRQTPARQVAEDFAAGRAEAMPSRVSHQARRNISADTRAPEQIQETLRTQRAAQADQDYGRITARVPVDDALISAVSDEPGMAAIRAARRGAVERRDATTVAELDGLVADISLRSELAGMNLGRMPQLQTPDLSAMTVERLRRAMGERAGRLTRAGNREQASGAMGRRGDIEDVLEGVPEAAAARANYRTASGQIDAVDAGGQFLGHNTDDFVARAGPMTPEERAVASAAAARAVEQAAQNTGSAPGVARSLYANPEQARRSQALLGDEGAARLAEGMRMESRALEASRQVNPRQGSNTNLNREDTLEAAGEAIGAARDVMQGNYLGLGARVIARLQSVGFNNRQTEAIVTAALDPARTDELIGMLVRSGLTRREARNLARTIRYQLTSATQ